jgi:sulfate permease, SulP family
MQIATTSASAIAAGQTVAGYPEAQRGAAMFLLTVVCGAAGALRPPAVGRWCASSPRPS